MGVWGSRTHQMGKTLLSKEFSLRNERNTGVWLWPIPAKNKKQKNNNCHNFWIFFKIRTVIPHLYYGWLFLNHPILKLYVNCTCFWGKVNFQNNTFIYNEKFTMVKFLLIKKLSNNILTRVILQVSYWQNMGKTHRWYYSTIVIDVIVVGWSVP